jgi:hemerythrin
MGMIQWNESLSVNVAEIDAQHQKLIGLINDLNAAMLQGKGRDVLDSILKGLVAYAETHFQTEERYFRQFGYPEAGPHQKAHADFVAKVKDFQKGFAADRAGLSVDVLLFLSDWLRQHIQIVDKKYGPFFNANGLR